MKNYLFCLLGLSCLFSKPVLVLAEVEKCSVPAKSIFAQINDLCFLEFETDDIAHPGVQACVDSYSSLSDTCANRTKLKSYRCQLLVKRGLLPKDISSDNCLESDTTEGLLVRGCEYPFDEKCIKQK